ncbi:4-(cytidine 5'-diphospho)-2-C-methyl-D-erythritol kinase [Acetobacterium wieringae]|uniref:4-(cytidine 5'-diphospho)-2-C-methyl-D-erythritol kinase n=1 Tax=Acetobacterium wieringae TaxID=52694 RepID=UPI0026F25096|nr:4-(cytidine 5'-diphospho)-2-C-methyl-D-erythritol kinase [Acetobacterium wieringae]
MNRVVLKAKAKVNLSLDVVGIREDGYHEMKMINHLIELDDILTFESCAAGISLTSNENTIPLDERNLVIKAAHKLQRQYDVKQGVKIHLEKRIPAQAGLAGGSSDAAATLKGLNSLWQLGLTQSELLSIGVTIGADVPYCLVGGTALVEGIGERITPLKDLRKMTVLVVKPDIDIATPWAFKKLDESIIKDHPDISAIIKLLRDDAYDRLNMNLGNVFEAVAFAKYPEIETVKNQMMERGALAAIMTGSGSTVIGYYQNQELAEKSWRFFKENYTMCFLSKTEEGENDVGR